MKNFGFGMMRLPLNGSASADIDQAQTNQMADLFLKSGFTYVDTAYGYHDGQSEHAVRKAFSERYGRESFVLADKMPVWLVKRHEDYERIFKEQLEKCGVGYFDYYLLHCLGVKAYADSIKCGGFEFLRELKAKGLAKHIGFSYHDNAELLDEILSKHPEIEFVQLQLNYADWENKTIQARLCCEAARKYGKGIIAMEPVKGGALANVPEEVRAVFSRVNPVMSAASWAIRYAASVPGVFMVLSGMSSLEQMRDNAGYMREFSPLSEKERAVVDAAAGIMTHTSAVPCTACDYCVGECPKKIAISKLFALYNDQSRTELRPTHTTYYANLRAIGGKASDCIECRACEARCPQHIEISQRMKDVAAVFER